jgi:hypothetical protein
MVGKPGVFVEKDEYRTRRWRKWRKFRKRC